jgi:polyphosphate kinase
MNRNIYRRIEVCFPLYESQGKTQIREILRLQLADTLASTQITSEGENTLIDPPPAGPRVTGNPIRSQEAIYRYLAGSTDEPTTGN